MSILVAPIEDVQLFKVKYSKKIKSGKQPMSLSRAEHASQQAVYGSFCGSDALVPHVLLRVTCLLCSLRGGGGTVILGMFPGTVVHRWLLSKGLGGRVTFLALVASPAMTRGCFKRNARAVQLFGWLAVVGVCCNSCNLFFRGKCV